MPCLAGAKFPFIPRHRNGYARAGFNEGDCRWKARAVSGSVSKYVGTCVV